ncbi:MAG: amidohydrolase family protein [Actinomycetota bacterium]
MVTGTTTWLCRGRLVDSRVVDVAVADGVIVAVEPSSAGRSGVDLSGALLVPSLGEPHAHLDKALTAERVPNPQGDLMGAIHAWVDAERRGEFGVAEMTDRAVRALHKLVANGVTLVRTHVNVGESDASHAHLRAVLAARDATRHLVDLQIVALMHSPLAGADGAGNRRALRESLELGADLVGGCPHLEVDGAGMIREAMAAARDAGVGLDLHVDETLDPTMLTLVDLAESILKEGFAHPVTASHCVSLSVQPVARQRELARRVGEAGIAVVPLPQTNLFLQGREQQSSMPRSIAPIDVLREAGVRVALGGDNVQDPFNPVGRSDPLETAALAIMASHQLPSDAFDLVSNGVRQVLGVPEVRLAVGDAADLMAIDAASTREAIADAPAQRRVFRRGVEVAVTSTTRRIADRA